MEYLFNLNQARCHLRDRSVYVVGGWFRFDNPEENTVRVFLDRTEVPCRMEIYDSPDIRVKYIAYQAGVTKEYFIFIDIPEDIASYKKLKVYTVSPQGESKFSSEVMVAKILQDQKEPDHCVDSVRFENGSCVISGWCAAVDPVETRMHTGRPEENGEPVDCHVQWSPRNDVKMLYREYGYMQHAGFVITLPDPQASELTLTFSSGDLKTDILMDMAAYRRSFENSKKAGGKLLGRMRAIAGKNLVRRTYDYIRLNGMRRFIERVGEKTLGKNSDAVIYTDWLKKHTPTEEELKAQHVKKMDRYPVFSVVVPLYKTPEHYLNELVDSVRHQSYSHWELILSDGSGENSPLDKVLDRLEASDERIHALRNRQQLRISENTNAGLAAAQGDYVVFADHDDLLTPDALFECAMAVNADPEIDFIYSDEDKVSPNGRKFFTPHFKPDFNIDMLRSMNYFCHLCVVRRSLIDQVGMLDPAYDGAQDYDFVLRCVEATNHIHHIPKILYHWRADVNSTSENPESKRYAFEAGARAIEDHCRRQGYDVTVSHGRYPGLYRVEYHWDEKPLISIIIPNKDHIDDLDQCIRSIEEKSSYKNYEYIIVENNSTDQATFDYYKDLEARVPHAHVVYYEGDFNFSRINNFGSQYAKGEYFLLLNNDTEIMDPECLWEMLSFCMRPDVGIVGARLFYPDDTIQHAGVVVGFGGVAGHCFVNFPKDHNGYCNRIIVAQDYSAVTAACLMVKRSVFTEVEGLDESFKVAFNDIDFCLKVREKGYLVVYNPNARLYHYESKSRGYEDTPEKIIRFQNEIATFVDKWSDILQKGDPYYNVNLTLDRQDFSLR